ncbi:MAG: di-trans,poly-cis-decaprenylcistransferase [Zetaproteobacteria bacterium]|nr:di-trans,poly-cis-decaprenylcistransferase [Zetaproteobacteria bacterium]
MRSSVSEASVRTPQHVAIIMDGNGRWAKQQGKVRMEGHRQGSSRVRDVVEWALDAGVKQVSLYAFSTENWKRPKLEVTALMTLLATLLPLEISRMNEKGARLLTLGDLSKLPWLARKAIQKTKHGTAQNKKIDLILCLNYGGQQEIVDGVQDFCRAWHAQGCSEDQLNMLSVDQFASYLPRKDVLPVDLLIRTGGERRISNFHLWDAAYAELYFTDCLWPDFSREDLQLALDDFAGRERRFGQTSEQVQGMESE